MDNLENWRNMPSYVFPYIYIDVEVYQWYEYMDAMHIWIGMNVLRKIRLLKPLALITT